MLVFIAVLVFALFGQDEEDRTPLHFAADRGQSAIVSRLLELGAAVDARDTDGMTPLAYAVACEHMKEIELLVRRNVRSQVAFTFYSIRSILVRVALTLYYSI